MPASGRSNGSEARGRVAFGAQANYYAFRLLGWAARHIPFALASRIARAFGLAVWALARNKRVLVTRNMRRALGAEVPDVEVGRSARRAFSNYALYWVDSFRLPSLTREKVDLLMSVDGMEENLLAAKSAGHGAILVLPHLGGWEIGGLWLANHDVPLTVVAERLEPPKLFEWFCALRESLGMTVIALDDRAAGALMQTLKAGKTVALLADRDLQGTGVEVEFFGEKTTLPSGPALLALRTGAALLPTAVYAYPDGRHQGVIGAAVPAERTKGSLRDDVARVTSAWAGEIERLIRRAPEQWHMFQPAWPSDR